MPYYTVQPRDTLWGIAQKRLGDPLRWSELAQLNGLPPPYIIVIGQKLVLPNTIVRQFHVPQTRTSTPVTPQTPLHKQPKEPGADYLTGRAFLFVLADEVLPSGKLVRKVVQFPNSVAESIASAPETFGLRPLNPESTVSIGEHALGNTQSRYTSASTLRNGAPNMAGRPVFIDIAKAKAAGAIIHSSEEIVADLYRLAQADPTLKHRVERLVEAIRHVEHEVLIEGEVPARAIKSASSVKLTGALRAVSVVGVVVTVYDLGQAGVKSVHEQSLKPIAAEGLRQAGGWGSAWVGMKAGCATGALVGIETGPGAIATCAVGGVAFGVAGYWGFDWLADFIYEN